MRPPWSLEELQQLLPRVRATIEEMEADCPGVRPVPPLAVEETLNLLLSLFGQAVERPLTNEESILGGQLLAQFQQAVTAETLGKRGRYYVLSEEQIRQMVEQV